MNSKPSPRIRERTAGGRGEAENVAPAKTVKKVPQRFLVRASPPLGPRVLPVSVVEAHWLPDGVRNDISFVNKFHKYMTCICATNTKQFATNAITFVMNTGYGKLRHFCDDPVCPEPRLEAFAKHGRSPRRERPCCREIGRASISLGFPSLRVSPFPQRTGFESNPPDPSTIFLIQTFESLKVDCLERASVDPSLEDETEHRYIDSWLKI